MSHEIRTPLSAVIGFADLLISMLRVDSEEQKYSEIIAQNGRQLQHIVDEILDLSKVESEEIKIEQLPFSLFDLIEDVTRLLAIKAQEKNLLFENTQSGDIPDTIISDATFLRQILINLVGNAIKFTESGAVRLHINKLSVGNFEDFGNGLASNLLDLKLEFLISDTGIGLTPEQKNVLFKPFAQGDESTTRRFGGTGLGLFLSKKLAKLLGGELTIKRSAPGEGSEFCLTLNA